MTEKLRLSAADATEVGELLDAKFAAMEADSMKAAFERCAYTIEDAAGNFLAGVTFNRFGREILLDGLWVEKAQRQQHLGSQLVAAVEDFARSHEVAVIRLSTYSDLAPDFYTKLGYQLLGRISDIPKLGIDRLEMVKYLG